MQLDTAFGTSSFPDNISTTYSSDGSTPLSTANFTVYGKAINFVPVANSTKFNTTFKTGILWDASNGGRYNSTTKQATVWVVKANASAQDAYGTYDYLVEIPYTLANYTGSNNMVSIYAELQ